MPRVPTISGPSVAEPGLPDARQSSIATPDLLSGPSREMQQAGQAVEGFGAQVAAVRKQLYDQANAARVDDALNQATEHALRLQHDPKEGFTSATGYDALNRPSGEPLAEEYTGKLTQKVSEIASTLSNDDQRRMFSAKVNNVVTSFYGHALAHEATQQRDYTLSVKDAAVASARNALSLNFTDPRNVEAQTTRIRAAIEGGQDERGTFIPGSAQMQGKSAAWAREKADEAISDAHGNAIKSALETGDVNLAMAYFKRYGGQMTAKDVLEVQGRLAKDYDTRQGYTIGNQIFDSAKPQIVPTDFVRLTSLVMGAESGGQRYAPGGGILTSPKGAKGEMQVVDSTNRDPGYGVRPAADDSPDERARVGRDYLGAMVKNYRGDISKALAAYNAGPGAVDKAVAEAAQDAKTGAFRGGAPGPNYWLTKLPKETQAYVASISAKFASGTGAPPKPTLSDLHDQVRATLGPDASPIAVKTAIEQVTQRYADEEKATKQRGETVVATAMQAVAQNGGRFGELPAGIRGDLLQHAPDKIDNVMTFAQRVAKGDDTTNPALYLRLSDPNVLRGTSEAGLYALRTELSQSDYQHFVNERSKLLNPTASAGPGDLNSSAIKNVLDQRLRELKIDPTPKDNGGDDAARVGAIRRVVDSELLAQQRATGKKFSDAETAQYIDRLFSTNTSLRGFLGLTSHSGPVLAANIGDVPSATKDAIKAAFKKQGVDNPTDAQVLSAFMHSQLRQGK